MIYESTTTSSSVQELSATNAAQAPTLSIVIPALNEQDNVKPLVEQVGKAMTDAEIKAELIIIDDGSTDQTLTNLKALQKQHAFLRVLHRPSPRGQSAAMHAGIQAARGRCIATLDADLQNDPADLPGMLEKIDNQHADMVQGDRSANRNDHAIRKIGSLIGRKARLWILNDPVRDTGCSARVVRAEIAKQFPLQFKGMHRFMPAYARMLGATIIEVPVSHHARQSGSTKYGMGLLSRGPAGLADLFAVRWMIKRYRDTTTDTITPGDVTEVNS